jgi:hypothetical protein
MEYSSEQLKKPEKSEIAAARVPSQPVAENTTTYKLTCSGCRVIVETSIPIAEGATYSCKGCASSSRNEKRGSKLKSPILANSAAFKTRLEPFRRLSFKGHEPEWFELALKLSVDPVNVLELVEAVHDGRWCGSNAPKQYILRRMQEALERSGSGMEDPFVYEGEVNVGGKGYRHAWKRRYDGKTVCFSERNADENFDVDLVADSRVHESQHATARKNEAAKGKIVAQFQDLRAIHIAEVEMGPLDEALDVVGADAFEKQVIRASIPRMTFTTGQKILANPATRFPATVIIPVVTKEGEECLLEVVVRSREEFFEKSSKLRLGASGFPCCLCEPNMTREELLASGATETERKALQAAYKRLQRNGVKAALRKELQRRALLAAIERADRRHSWESDFEPEDHGKHTKARRVDHENFSGTVRKLSQGKLHIANND